MPLPSFEDVNFPLRIAFGASGGPDRRNEIVPLTNGSEQRNARRRHARRRWDVGTGVRSLADLREVTAFFEARRGSLIAFRFADPFDRTSGTRDAPSPLDERIGEGDGSATRFPLFKRYGAGTHAYERPIALPRLDTLTVAVDGVEVEASFDAQSRVVVLSSPAPAGGVVTAGFGFDVPVRFDLEHLSVSIVSFEAGELPTIPLVEVRL